MERWLWQEYEDCTKEEASTTLKEVHMFVNDYIKKKDIRLHDDELVKAINKVFPGSVIKECDTSKYPWHYFHNIYIYIYIYMLLSLALILKLPYSKLS